MDIIELMKKEVKERCHRPENIYGTGIWSHHILAVIENAQTLAKHYDADMEVVTLAAILHDIASITKAEYAEEHHIIGGEMAEKLLRPLGYPQAKIEHIKLCILNHRGSKISIKQSFEEVCLADADALSHFDNIPSLFRMVYKERGMTIDEGADFVKQKLERSFSKLSEATKTLYREKYLSVMSIFN